MSGAVLTPISQAMAEGALTRRDLKALMRRSNAPALRRLVLWIMLVAATGSLVWLALGTLWLVPAMVLHGIVLVHHFSLQHECVHYTAFRTRWLNDAVGSLCGFVIMLPLTFFRFEHCDHHTFTQQHGRDPELIDLPRSFRGYLLYLSGLPYWRAKVSELARHLRGRFSADERRFLPLEIRGRVVLEARLMAGLYLAILAACALSGWWAPLWFWWLPVVLGEPFMRAIRMTEHVARPQIRDMTVNTRTSLTHPLMRFLCWNMNYHAEHHYAASVPFHALPALHRRLAGYVHVEEGGYLGAHAAILRAIARTREERAGGA